MRQICVMKKIGDKKMIDPILTTPSAYSAPLISFSPSTETTTCLSFSSQQTMVKQFRHLKLEGKDQTAKNSLSLTTLPNNSITPNPKQMSISAEQFVPKVLKIVRPIKISSPSSSPSPSLSTSSTSSPSFSSPSPTPPSESPPFSPSPSFLSSQQTHTSGFTSKLSILRPTKENIKNI